MSVFIYHLAGALLFYTKLQSVRRMRKRRELPKSVEVEEEKTDMTENIMSLNPRLRLLLQVIVLQLMTPQKFKRFCVFICQTRHRQK